MDLFFIRTSLWLTEIISVVGAITLVAALLWYGCMRRALDRRRVLPAPLVQYPSITVVRPVRGADVGAAENVAAALDTGYPGEVETLFIFDDEQDPGLPVVRRAVARHQAS